MPFGSIQLKPGVNTIATPTLNVAGVSQSNLIRWKDGLPEKYGGWTRYVPSSMGSVTRALHAWQDLNQNKWLASGNLSSLKVMLSGSVTTITPQMTGSNVLLNVSSVKGSKVITIVDPNISNLIQYDSVFMNTPISIGGLIIAGLYQINATGASGSSYTIVANSPATVTENNVGTIPQFTTTTGSNIVTVTLLNHGLSTGDKFVFPVPSAVANTGITINGVYSNIVVVDSANFTITASVPAATDTALYTMNNGLAGYQYGLTGGPSIASASGGIGPIGQFAIGEGFVIITSNSPQTGTPITTTDWSLDNWGEILLACPRGGEIWYWPPSSGFQSMIPIGTGPRFNNGIFVAMPQQILVAWGSTSTLTSANTDAAQDPLIVRWSDQLDFTNWNVNINTQAGSFHIPTGSEIRGAIQSPQQALIFTDLDCWSMQYMGPPLVFGFNQIGTGCGLVGSHAVANLYGRTYWMNDSNFFFTTGQGVQEIPCTVWDNVFQDLDTANKSKCVAAANSAFNEITFFFPSISGGTGECDKYAKLNVVSGLWDYGSLSRSAWVDTTVLGNPIGADPTTTLLQTHESGYDNDGSAMDSFFETGYFPYGDGENFGVIDYFEPDMKWKTVNGSSTAQVAVTLTAVPSPNGAQMISGPATMTSTTEYITPRLRGRQIKWRLETVDLGSWWRLGNIRYRFTVDGRR